MEHRFLVPPIGLKHIDFVDPECKNDCDNPGDDIADQIFNTQKLGARKIDDVVYNCRHPAPEHICDEFTVFFHQFFYPIHSSYFLPSLPPRYNAGDP